MMKFNKYLVTYDKIPGKDYAQIYSDIKATSAHGGNYHNAMDSVWLLESLLPHRILFNLIKSSMDEKDKLIVVDLETSKLLASGLDNYCAPFISDDVPDDKPY